MELMLLAAGRGSRFAEKGITIPKPLVLFQEKPLFWWAVQSALSSGMIKNVHFTILEEHIFTHSIDEVIRHYFPLAKLHVLKKLTQGAAETAAESLEGIDPFLPISILDCDLAFGLSSIQAKKIDFTNNQATAVLCTFQSSNPAYSYVRFDKNNNVEGAVEKQVVSSHAIAGMYSFASAEVYLRYYQKYAKICSYKELYISGLVDLMAQEKNRVLTADIFPHISMGTPEELARIDSQVVQTLSWYKP